MMDAFDEERRPCTKGLTAWNIGFASLYRQSDGRDCAFEKIIEEKEAPAADALFKK